MQIRKHWRWAVLAAAVLAIYLPALGGGLIWDDSDIYIRNNPLLRLPDGIWRFWFTGAAADYYPLAYTTFWFEWQLAGEATWLYHVNNLLLHLLATALLHRLLRDFGVPWPGLAALLFAIYPLQVETVAWISQRKTLLGTVFGFACLLDYRRAGASAGGSYWRSLLWFTLSLAGKPVLIMLPVFLFCLEGHWRSGWVQALRRTVPFFLLSAVFGVVGLAFQAKCVGLVDVRGQEPLARLASTGWAAWFYIIMLANPCRVNFVYPRWEINAAQPLDWLPLAGIAAVSLLLYAKRRQTGALLPAAWGAYLLSMLPALGLADVFYWRYSYVADHYVYQSMPALLAMIVWVLHRLAGRSAAWRRGIVVAAAVWCVCLCWLTWRQAHSYQSEERLWQDTLAKNPRAALALNNLGCIRTRQGHAAAGLRLLEQAVAADPAFYEAWLNIGWQHLSAGRWDEALQAFQQAGELAPAGHPAALQAMGGAACAQYQLGRLGAAAATLDRLAGFFPEPGSPVRPASLAIVFSRATAHLSALASSRGDRKAAAAWASRAAEFAAAHPAAGRELARSWLELGRPALALEKFSAMIGAGNASAADLVLAGIAAFQDGNGALAVNYLQAAAALEPHTPAAWTNLGVVYQTAGRPQEAAAHLRRAAEMQPDNPGIQARLALALAVSGNHREAAAAFRCALELEPRNAGVKRDLAWLLATSPIAGPDTAAEALKLAVSACELTGNHCQALEALAAAQARNGRFTDAAATALQALDAARVSGAQPAALRQMEKALELYRQGKAFDGETRN